ncbi:RNA ligase [Paraconexibacter sp. AEG42_29]|uniref:RNA ligase n=1 Tax=Paraconexibacter sp. AEG42_29 TaxID=2997339 RepID=A0AAU7AU71_9ACTN
MTAADRFVPYPKLREVAADEPGGTWVATEKLHGANLAIVVTRTDVALAKRRAVLTPDAMPGFFGVQRLWPALAASGRLALDALPGTQALILYGELVGGGYPAAAAGSPDGAGPVQTGIAYSPGLVWCGFDARAEHDDGSATWLAVDERLRVLAAAGLPAVPELARGGLTALRRLPVLFPSRLPATLGLPPLAGNDAEGFVLMPAGPQPVSGSRTAEKHKQPRFAEDERYAGARPAVVGDAVDAELTDLAQALLTPARAQAARSKTGLDAEATVAELVADVLDAVDEQVGGLDAPARASLEAAVGPAAWRLLGR